MISSQNSPSLGRGKREPHHHHRKRISVSKLSSDTTATLPEYTSPRANVTTQHLSWKSSEVSDLPPDYPDSAEEADEETDDYLSPPISPRRQRKFQSASRHRNPPPASIISASDTFLDSLLERSVNALELSNVLLQSSMSTQTAISTAFASDSVADQRLESRARRLNSRIRNHHVGWMNDLDNLAKGVESLYDYGEGEKFKLNENAISRSLPTLGPHVVARRNRRQPSLELRRGIADAPRLHMSTERRPPATQPPRALTQYVSVESTPRSMLEATTDLTSILLPSTLALRSTSHMADLSPPMNRSSVASLNSAFSSYTSLVEQARSSRSASPASTRISRSVTPRAGERHKPSPQRRRSHSSSRSWSSSTHRAPSPSPMARPPPIAELPSTSDSSSSSDGPRTFRTVESLRKILDEQQAVTTETKGKTSTNGSHPRPPVFTPRSPPVAPVAGTSSTTTSISRLLTKGTHSTSTRAPSPPRHSSLKQRSAPPTPTTLIIPELSSAHSRDSSGRSTPKVAFGPLPESYASSKGGSSAKFREKKGKEKVQDRDQKKDSVTDASWWTTWLTGGSGLTMHAARHEERMEERVARSMGRSGFGGGMDDWAI